MRRRSLRPLLLTCAALASPLASASTWHVPGDFPDPQIAINVAASGDTIIIHGGTWKPIVITKSIRLVGDPAPTFEPWAAGDLGSGAHPPLIQLLGPGAGTVVLQSINTGGGLDANFYYSLDSTIGGVRFDALHIYDSNIQAPTWQYLSGGAFGGPGIDISIPELIVSHSTVVGGRDEDDWCNYEAQKGQTGIKAWSVLLIDSTVTGGRGDVACVDAPWCDPGTAINGEGGTGIECNRLFLGGTTSVQGGAGGKIYCNGSEVGQFADGADMSVGTLIPLPGTLNDSGSTALGSNWYLTWDSSAIFLIVAGAPGTPILLPSKGWIFFNPGTLLLFTSIPGGTTGGTIPIPVDPNIIGMEVVAQVAAFPSGLSRPVIRALGP